MANSILNASGIYWILNTVNWKCYVGSAHKIRTRWAQHRSDLNHKKHHSPRLQNSWNKHGAEMFEFLVLEEVSDKSLLVQREQFWIDLLHPEYNICLVAGSSIGVVRSDDFKKKVSIAVRARPPISAETRGKLSASSKRLDRHIPPMTPEQRALADEKRRGVTRTPEQREKIRVGTIESIERRKLAGVLMAHSGETKRKIGVANSGKKHPGKKLSEETKRKIGDANRGNKPPPISEETRKKLSDAHMGRTWTPEQIAKRVATKKANKLAKQQAA